MASNKYQTILYGFATREEAELHASRLAGDPKMIVGVSAGRPGEAYIYFVAPNGQPCPCCGRPVDLTHLNEGVS